MNRNILIYFMLFVVVAAFAGAAGIAVYGAFKAGGNVYGIISIGVVLVIAYVLFSFIYKKYRIYKGVTEDRHDDNDAEARNKNEDKFGDDKL